MYIDPFKFYIYPVVFCSIQSASQIKTKQENGYVQMTCSSFVYLLGLLALRVRWRGQRLHVKSLAADRPPNKSIDR